MALLAEYRHGATALPFNERLEAADLGAHTQRRDWVLGLVIPYDDGYSIFTGGVSP